MRSIILLFVLAFCSTVFAQTDGMSYQAVILNPNLELPGVDDIGSIYVNKALDVRFTIFDSNNSTEYQESHYTSTNDFGMINLVIGSGSPETGVYKEIFWDGTPKTLTVEINLGQGFEELSSQALLYTPFALYRDLIATGDLTVVGNTSLEGNLNVGGSTTLEDTLIVTNQSPTILSGSAMVDGATILNDSLFVNNGAPVALTGDLTVDGITDLNDSLNINNGAPTLLTGKLQVNDSTTLEGPLQANGQVTIDATLAGSDGDYNAYPLRVQGSGQGIAIQLDNTTPNNNNNFVTFYNSSGGAVGRIEGETINEFDQEFEFQFQRGLLVAELGVATANQVSSFIPVAPVVGTCGGCIASAAADLALATANLASYEIFATENLGVTYQSGSADYAEWLERLDSNEFIQSGDIVGVYAGEISKNTSSASQFMVISTKPAMLGNMPIKGTEHRYNKVAFMGQIPVKVRGIVFAGDYILPSGNNDGTGIAVAPEEIEPHQYKSIVGVAWSSVLLDMGTVSYIIMAIGLNSNDLASLSERHEEKINQLEQKYSALEKRITALETGSSLAPEELKETSYLTNDSKKTTRVEYLLENLPTHLSNELMEEALFNLENSLLAKGVDISKNERLNKIFNDPLFRANIIMETQANYKIAYQNLLAMNSK